MIEVLKKSFFSFLLLLLSFTIQAQFTQVGNGLFTAVNQAPMRSGNQAPIYNRCAYIYNVSVLGNIRNGDSISSISFKADVFDSMIGSPNFKIYLANSVFSDFVPAAVNWNDLIKTSTLVFDGNPAPYLNTQTGFIRFPFNVRNNYIFNSTNSAFHLQVLVEYTQTDSQQLAIDWFVENQQSQPNFSSQNETKWISGIDINNKDTFLSNSSLVKPTLRIEYPSNSPDIEVLNIYTLGTIARLMDQGDTIKALIRNISKKIIYQQKVYLGISGVSSYSDSVTIDSILPFQEKIIQFVDYQPFTDGIEQITVSVPNDANNANNIKSINRTVNYNRMSHNNPFTSISGGIGIGGATGDFVAKFHCKGDKVLNQITVEFTSVNAPFQLGIWEVDSNTGLPSGTLFMSDTLRTTRGLYILDLSKKVKVKNHFFVGIRQTSPQNVGFAYQTEAPVRPVTFYFSAPVGSTDWVPFSPGFDFNFGIMPRLQAANDVAITEITSPVNNFKVKISHKFFIVPKAIVKNIGYLDQQNPFKVSAQIRNIFGSIVYSSEKSITLLADSSLVLAFDTFFTNFIGEYRLTITNNLAADSILDNNSKQVEFEIFKDIDMALPFSYSPVEDQVIVRNQYVWSAINVYNVGKLAATNVKVYLILYQDADTFYKASATTDIDPQVSTTLVFDSFPLLIDGYVNALFYVNYPGDSTYFNDTLRVRFFVDKTQDLIPLYGRVPIPNGTYGLGSELDPLMRVSNEGSLDYDSARFTITITDPTDSVLLHQTAVKDITSYQSTDLPFSRITLPKKIGTYNVMLIADEARDQKRANDTLRYNFEVRPDYDLMLMIQGDLNNGDTLGLKSRFDASLKLKNNGLKTVNNVATSWQIFDTSGLVRANGSFLSNTLHSGEDTSFVLSVFMTNWEKGKYTLLAKTEIALDASPQDNEASLIYYIDTLVDIQLINFTRPKNNQILQINTAYQPTFVVRNAGLVAATANMKYEIKQANTILQSQVQIVDIQQKEQKEVQFDSAFSLSVVGNYTITIFVEKSDSFQSNDTLHLAFLVKDSTVGIAKIEKHIFSIFPNPSSGRLTVSGKHPIYKIIVADIFGRELTEQTKSSSTLLKDKARILQLPNGVYFIHIYTSENMFEVHKVIVGGQ